MLHYLFAVSAYGRKIFYFKHTPLEYITLIIITLKHYLYDFFKKKDKILEERHEKENEHETVLNLNKRAEELEKAMQKLSKFKEYY